MSTTEPVGAHKHHHRKRGQSLYSSCIQFIKEKTVREPVGLVGRFQTQGTGYKSDGIMVLAVVAPVES